LVVHRLKSPRRLELDYHSRDQTGVHWIVVSLNLIDKVEPGLVTKLLEQASKPRHAETSTTLHIAWSNLRLDAMCSGISRGRTDPDVYVWIDTLVLLHHHQMTYRVESAGCSKIPQGSALPITVISLTQSKRLYLYQTLMAPQSNDLCINDISIHQRLKISIEGYDE